MTDEQISNLWETYGEGDQLMGADIDFARAIEARARAEQHAECVRLCEAQISNMKGDEEPYRDGWNNALYEVIRMLESQKT